MDRRHLSNDPNFSEPIIEVIRTIGHRHQEYCFRNIMFLLIDSDLFTTGQVTKVEQLPKTKGMNPRHARGDHDFCTSNSFKIQGRRAVHKTFIQSSQPAGPTAKTLRSPRIASSNHKEQKSYPNVESGISLPGQFRVRQRILPRH